MSYTPSYLTPNQINESVNFLKNNLKKNNPNATEDELEIAGHGAFRVGVNKVRTVGTMRFMSFEVNVLEGDTRKWYPVCIYGRDLATGKITTIPEEGANKDENYAPTFTFVGDAEYTLKGETYKWGEAVCNASKAFLFHMENAIATKQFVWKNNSLFAPAQFMRKANKNDPLPTVKLDTPFIRIAIDFNKKTGEKKSGPGDTIKTKIYDKKKPDPSNKNFPYKEFTVDGKIITFDNLPQAIVPGSVLLMLADISSVMAHGMGISLKAHAKTVLVEPPKPATLSAYLFDEDMPKDESQSEGQSNGKEEVTAVNTISKQLAEQTFDDDDDLDA